MNPSKGIYKTYILCIFNLLIGRSLPDAKEYRCMKKIIWNKVRSKTNINKKCRNCDQDFENIGGFLHCDNDCCSESCFIMVGIKPNYTPILETKSEVKRSLKAKRRRERKKYNAKNSDFYRSQEWLSLRYLVLKKYGRVCMTCGRTSGQMHVDHIKPKSKFPDLALVFDNLQVLCKECNYGKSNIDYTDFRPK